MRDMMTMKQVCEEIAAANQTGRFMLHPKTGEPMTADELWHYCTPNGELIYLFGMLDHVRNMKKKEIT